MEWKLATQARDACRSGDTAVLPRAELWIGVGDLASALRFYIDDGELAWNAGVQDPTPVECDVTGLGMGSDRRVHALSRLAFIRQRNVSYQASQSGGVHLGARPPPTTANCSTRGCPTSSPRSCCNGLSSQSNKAELPSKRVTANSDDE